MQPFLEEYRSRASRRGNVVHIARKYPQRTDRAAGRTQKTHPRREAVTPNSRRRRPPSRDRIDATHRMENPPQAPPIIGDRGGSVHPFAGVSRRSSKKLPRTQESRLSKVSDVQRPRTSAPPRSRVLVCGHPFMRRAAKPARGTGASGRRCARHGILLGLLRSGLSQHRVPLLGGHEHFAGL